MKWAYDLLALDVRIDQRYVLVCTTILESENPLLDSDHYNVNAFDVADKAVCRLELGNGCYVKP